MEQETIERTGIPKIMLNVKCSLLSRLEIIGPEKARI